MSSFEPVALAGRDATDFVPIALGARDGFAGAGLSRDERHEALVDRTFEHTFVGERATHVAVDAQREDLLDPSRLDNAWSATPSDVPLFKRLWFLGEALLFTVGP